MPLSPLSLLRSLCLALAFSAAVHAAEVPLAPEPATGYTAKQEATGKKHMAATANAYASEAARHILRKGGNAIDAAIAAQLVLNVVEPQSSGIGGGGFLLYYDAQGGKPHVYDGRETAPAAASEKRFLDFWGKPRAFEDIVRGGAAVATPGLPALLWKAHQAHGKLAWPELFKPAIALAEKGFPVSARMSQVAATIPYLKDFPESRALYFREDGALKQPGDLFVNAPLADAFQNLASKGVEDFYRGELAREIVEAVKNAPINAGDLALGDLERYEVKERPMLCRRYREYRICSMSPPSSGGVTLLQALGMLERFPLHELKPGGVEAVHLISQATMLAFADRDRYLGDPDFVNVPVKALLDPAYLARRSQRIREGAFTPKPHAGVPDALKDETDCTGVRHVEAPSTTHLSVVDEFGNAVAMTTSVEYAFGSGMTVHGFILNNHMTDFSSKPVDASGCKVPNRIEPGKRPRSAMSPTLVFDKEGWLVMTLGSPGGPRIIPYVLQTLIGVIDWKLGIQEAINQPHYANLLGKTELEDGTPLVDLRPALEKLGHEVVIREMNSGLHGILIARGQDGRTLHGGADPRREGEALGD